MNGEVKSIRPFKSDKIPLPRWGEEFNASEFKALDIEIGCGVGLHPIQYSLNNLNRQLVAIEHTRNKYDKFMGRYISHGSPQNLIPVHANGISWVTHLLPKSSVDRFFFLYPNPNPKSSDISKRWHAMPFMEKVIECLKPGGEIIIATNESFYQEEAKVYMTQAWGLKLKEESLSPFDFRGRTHFERKYLERGQTCYNLVFSRV